MQSMGWGRLVADLTGERRRLQLLAGLALGLALFYLSWIPFPIRLHGALLFGVLALLRPDLALLFVPLTAPLYLMPAELGGLRDRAVLLPLHEVALLITAGAAGARAIWRRARERRLDLPALRWADIPIGLFLAAGVWGALIALPGARGEALRELRWLVIEPLMLVILLRTLRPSPVEGAAKALLLAGALVGGLGLLQYVGLDLVPWIGEKRSFSENIVDVGSARRVASVYGHPNNLGLFLGRVWPIGAALAIAALRRRPRNPKAGMPATAALISLAGLLVSFSRGAWIGAAAALAALLLAFTRARLIGIAALGGGALAAALLLGLVLRGEGGSEGTRLLLWREAIGYLTQHPLGIGLDQFYAYHAPDSGLSLIAPTLIGTSEQYAAHPHNLVLDIWLRMGPLGLIAFGWLAARALATLWRARQAGRAPALAAGAGAALAAALTHGLVDQFYFVPDLAIAFWLLLAMIELPTGADTTQDGASDGLV